MVAYCLGTSMMMGDFTQDGMGDCVRERLKILVKRCKNNAAQALITFPGTLSGPEDFLGLTPLTINSTPCGGEFNGWELEAGWGWDVVVADCWVGVSKRVKKELGSYTSVMLESAAVLICPLKLVTNIYYVGQHLNVDFISTSKVRNLTCPNFRQVDKTGQPILGSTIYF